MSYCLATPAFTLTGNLGKNLKNKTVVTQPQKPMQGSGAWSGTSGGRDTEWVWGDQKEADHPWFCLLWENSRIYSISCKPLKVLRIVVQCYVLKAHFYSSMENGLENHWSNSEHTVLARIHNGKGSDKYIWEPSKVRILNTRWTEWKGGEMKID